MRNPSLGLALLLGLVACAAGPPIAVTSQGALPSPARSWTYQVMLSNVGSHEAELRAAIAASLQQAHLTPTASSPDLLVEGVYSDRPGVVGAYSATSPGGAMWLATPLRRPWWGKAPDLRSVGIVLIDARSGRELYRARATEGRDQPDGAEIARLVTAAISGVTQTDRERLMSTGRRSPRAAVGP